MSKELKPQLNVCLFGGFRAYYNETELTFGKQNNSKFSQLFQLLMTRPKQNFSKRMLIQSIYETDEIENPNDSLNSTIFRLRQYFKKSVLPKGEYLIIKGGVMRIDGPVDIISDVWEFECLEKNFEEEKDTEKKAEIAQNACALYKGEFLPQLASEQWVIQHAHEYKEKYKKMLRYLLDFFKDRNEYMKMAHFATCAMEIYPLEGWEIWVVDSLVAQGKLQEAGDVYRALIKQFKQLGNEASNETAQELFREIEAHLQMSGETTENIDRHLAEKEEYAGAYCCSLLGFTDYFRILKRIRLCERFNFCVLICTIVKIDGSPIESKNSSKRMGEKLQETFKTCLRAGDVFTKYNANQYLLICIGADDNNSLDIGTRIDIDFQKRCGRRYGISYQNIPVD